MIAFEIADGLRGTLLEGNPVDHLAGMIEKALDEKDKWYQAARDTAIKNHWHKHMGIDCVFGASAEGCVDLEIERQLKDLEPKK